MFLTETDRPTQAPGDLGWTADLRPSGAAFASPADAGWEYGDHCTVYLLLVTAKAATDAQAKATAARWPDILDVGKDHESEYPPDRPQA